MPLQMSSKWALRIALGALTVVLVLAGASMNASGRVGWATLFAGVAGLLVLAAAVAFTNWRLFLPLAGAGLVLTLLIAQFNPKQGDLLMQLGGLLLLWIGGGGGGPPGPVPRAPQPGPVPA